MQSFHLAACGRTMQREHQAAFQKLVQGALCVQSVLGTPLWLLSLFGLDVTKVHVV